VPILKNSRHEKFAQCLAGGASATNCYVVAGYSAKGAQPSASALLSNPIVSARVAELKERSNAKADITRTEIIKILANYARSHPDDYTHDVRLKAIQQLTKMTGWDAPSEIKVSADNELTELLKRLRGGGS